MHESEGDEYLFEHSFFFGCYFYLIDYYDEIIKQIVLQTEIYIQLKCNLI